MQTNQKTTKVRRWNIALIRRDSSHNKTKSKACDQAHDEENSNMNTWSLWSTLYDKDGSSDRGCAAAREMISSESDNEPKVTKVKILSIVLA